MTTQERTGGHVFVLAGDLNKLHADAVLVPTDRALNLSGSFRPLVRQELGRMPWPKDSLLLPLPHNDGPQVVLADVGRWTGADPTFLTEIVDAFAHWGSEAEIDGSPEFPLLALPVIGTGQGGFRDDQGQIYDLLIPSLLEAAGNHSVDLALVCWGGRAYSAAQRVRQRLVDQPGEGMPPRWELGPGSKDLTETADRLAQEAAADNLVLFMGAGLSAGAGIPLWQPLLDRIATSSDPSFDLEALHRLDLRDQAAVLERRIAEGDVTLTETVVEAVSGGRYTVAEGLLASLRNREAVTTNYDDLFEEAVRAAGETIAVLPHEAVHRRGRWLLKLHGSVDRPESIVLTRNDYLGVPETHGALFGLVQALLLTRHMIFVGYSLSDDDFHQLIHEVRRARSTESSRAPTKLGTVLTLFHDAMFEELWGDDVVVVSMSDNPSGKPSDQELQQHHCTAERRLAVLLDLIAFRSADLSRYLLDPTYESMLDPIEKELAAALAKLREAAEGDHPVQQRVRSMIDGLTADDAPRRVPSVARSGVPLVAMLEDVCPPGTEIQTLAQRKPNWIVGYSRDGVLVHTEQSKGRGEPQLVDEWMLSAAWEHLRHHGSLANSYLLATDGLNVKRSSAVCALLATLPKVRVVSTRPIVLAWIGD